MAAARGRWTGVVRGGLVLVVVDCDVAVALTLAVVADDDVRLLVLAGLSDVSSFCVTAFVVVVMDTFAVIEYITAIQHN